MPNKTAVILTCGHADPAVKNDRYSWLGEFLYDIKPDYVVDLGDGADMRSLNTFDGKYPEAVVSQSYEKDIEVYNDSMERIRWKFRQNKRKRPYFIGFEGNHEHRIKRAIAYDPRLEGSKFGISFKHLQTKYWFDDYHEYQNSGPSIADYDGVSYAHFFSSGNFGTATAGLHHAYALLQNRNYSSTCGHSHKRSVYFKDGAHPTGIIGLVAGCFKGGEESWAGQANRDWWKGVVIKRDIDNGIYDPEFVSLDKLRSVYGKT